MFHLTKEVDEVKFEYYLMKQAPSGVIELALSDIARLLGVSKSKAQRLIEKFLQLGILVIEKKSTSRNTKTVYRYTPNTNINTNTDTNNYLNTNRYIDRADIKGETKYTTMIDVYEQYFKSNSFIKSELKLYEDEMELELFEYLLEQISNRSDIKAKDKYLISTLKDLKSHSVKTISDFIEHTGKHKKQLERQKLSNKWGYTPSSEDIDFDEIVKLSRR